MYAGVREGTSENDGLIVNTCSSGGEADFASNPFFDYQFI
jgi:hypothetical protein